MLISAVARVYSPGCKVDTMLVLHEDLGGRGKSTFFRTLAGDDFFSDDPIDTHNKDSAMVLRTIWFHEWSEMELFSSRASREAVKGFVTRRTDRLREPYARAVTDYPRRMIFTGSTNKRTFLEDDGGNRRFHVISDVGAIDVARVAKLRTELWSQAVAEYRAGIPWWLNTSAQTTHNELQRENMHEDVGLDTLGGFLANRASVTVEDILANGPLLFRASSSIKPIRCMWRSFCACQAGERRGPRHRDTVR
jgi:predicted P-loop ATPase